MTKKKKRTTKSGDSHSLRPTDMYVLRHVVLYQLTFKEALAAAIFNGAENPENAAVSRGASNRATNGRFKQGHFWLN